MIRSPRLILASASSRRLSLLQEAGYWPIVHPSNVNERALESPGLLPEELARLLASAKAECVAELFPADVVLAADTVVALDDQPLGKPIDAADARRMLKLLGGTTHRVITAVVVLRRNMDHRGAACVTSTVRMRELTGQELDAYVESGGWRDKAGGYGIQDAAGNASAADPFVQKLAGCATNIVGLPMTTVKWLLTQAGIEAHLHQR